MDRTMLFKAGSSDPPGKKDLRANREDCKNGSGDCYVLLIPGIVDWT